MIRPLTKNQLWLLDYLADLNDEFEARDYSTYGADACAIRTADLAFMNKVGMAFRNDSQLWNS